MSAFPHSPRECSDAARYLPHRDCEAYVAGPAAMVRETIRVLARAGIPQQRIHYDDALPRAERRSSPEHGQHDTQQFQELQQPRNLAPLSF